MSSLHVKKILHHVADFKVLFGAVFIFYFQKLVYENINKKNIFFIFLKLKIYLVR